MTQHPSAMRVIGGAPMIRAGPARDRAAQPCPCDAQRDHYRYDKSRSLTATELAEIELLHDELQEIVPLLEAIPSRLDS